MGYRRWTRATSCLAYCVLYTNVDAQCDKLHSRAVRSNVENRKYCQLSSTDDDRVITLSVHRCPAKLTTRDDKRCAVAKISKFGT